MPKTICNDCVWRGDDLELLREENPFEKNDFLYACPNCKSIFGLRVACDEPECWNEVTCGTPTPNGYRQTCGKHAPKINREEI